MFKQKIDKDLKPIICKDREDFATLVTVFFTQGIKGNPAERSEFLKVIMHEYFGLVISGKMPAYCFDEGMPDKDDIKSMREALWGAKSAILEGFNRSPGGGMPFVIVEDDKGGLHIKVKEKK